ncbi:hypothetical protein ACHAPJ_009285 [Fusarium lateritium]
MAKSVFSDLKRFGYSTDTRDQPEQETTSRVDGDAPHPSKTPSRGSAKSQQVHPRQGNNRRWEDTVESPPRPRKVGRTVAPDHSPGAREAQDAIASTSARHVDAAHSESAVVEMMQRIARLEERDAAQRAETRRWMDRIEVLEVENLALKQKVARLESERD